MSVRSVSISIRKKKNQKPQDARFLIEWGPEPTKIRVRGWKATINTLAALRDNNTLLGTDVVLIAKAAWILDDYLDACQAALEGYTNYVFTSYGKSADSLKNTAYSVKLGDPWK